MNLLSRKASRHTALALATGLMLASCAGGSDDAFVNEYEELNGQETSNGQTYLAMDIPDDHRFTTATEEQVRQLLTDGDGAIFFGFPECPWCRNAVPVMDEAAEAVNLDEIYYVNVHDMRDEKALDENDEIVVDKEGTEFYYYLLEELGDQAPEYSSLEDPSERRISVPLVAVVVGGDVITTHLGTVDSQEDPYVPLTEEQHNELLESYKTIFTRIPGCSEDEYICE
ncbi:thioredoxin family protein [Actinomycetaceae bacterium L2_0104]